MVAEWEGLSLALPHYSYISHIIPGQVMHMAWGLDQY